MEQKLILDHLMAEASRLAKDCHGGQLSLFRFQYGWAACFGVPHSESKSYLALLNGTHHPTAEKALWEAILAEQTRIKRVDAAAKRKKKT